jgi:hypothetical protein
MKRPTSVTVFGVLNVVFGAIGLYAIGAVLLLSHGLVGNGDPLWSQLGDTSTASGKIRMLELRMDVLLSLIQFVSGIGLLRWRPWGISTAIAYAIASLASSLVFLVLNFYSQYEPLLEQTGAWTATEKALAAATLLSTMFGRFAYFIYPSLLLYFMYGSNVIPRFHQALPSTADAERPSGRQQPETGNPYQSP